MSALVRFLFPKNNIVVDTDIKQSINPALDPYTTNPNKIYDKNKYFKILNKSYQDILLSADEMSFLETIPRKKLNIILNINRNNRSCDKLECICLFKFN
jgi:hypothetical protein